MSNIQTGAERMPHHLFFFNDTASTEIYTLSLHDALPISIGSTVPIAIGPELEGEPAMSPDGKLVAYRDRKSTRLNSSHLVISYAVFCLKKRMPHDLSHLGFLAGQIVRLITISTTPVIAGDSFEMDAVGALRLSPLRRGLAIDSTVDIFTFYVPHRHVYGEQ